MGRHVAIENRIAADAETDSSVYVPTLQLTEGQPPPIAANGGLSYMSFDRDGDAGTAAALEAALDQIAEGSGEALIELIDNAPPGPIETRWGPGFREYGECLEHIRANGIEAPEGGLALPLRYTVHEEPSYSIVSSNSLWRDPAREAEANLLRKAEEDNGRRYLYFPQVMRDARRIGEYYPGLSVSSPECMDRLGVSLAHLESKCANFYDSAEVERVFYPEIERLLLEFFPDATDALVYNHDVFDKDYQGDRTEDQEAKNPGVNARYANLVHNDLNDNSGRVRCRELLTKNLRNFGREQHYTEAEADAKMSRTVHVDQPRQADGDRGPVPLRALRLAFVRRPALHHQLPHLRRPRRRDHPLHLPPRPRVVLVSPAEADRGLDAQVLRLHHRRLGLALVVPHRLHRPDRARRRALPQERRGPLVRLLVAFEIAEGRYPVRFPFRCGVPDADGVGSSPRSRRFSRTRTSPARRKRVRDRLVLRGGRGGGRRRRGWWCR